MFTCKKCNTNKPETEFYRHDKMATGHLSFCKDCVKTRVHDYQEVNIEKIRDADRKYGQRPETKARLQVYIHKYRIKYPERYKATNILNNAIRDNKIIKPVNCDKCGIKGKVYGHHKNYSKPLEVEWLCPPCHSAIHLRKNPFESLP